VFVIGAIFSMIKHLSYCNFLLRLDGCILMGFLRVCFVAQGWKN